jgi:hypothetical protein
MKSWAGPVTVFVEPEPGFGGADLDGSRWSEGVKQIGRLRLR